MLEDYLGEEMMTEKNYEKIAKILRNAHAKGLDKSTVDFIEDELMTYFYYDNPAFSAARFNAAIYD